MAGLFGALWRTRSVGGGVPSYGSIPPLGSVASAAGLPVSQATAMRVSAVHACVRTIATDAARCAPMLFRVDPDGSREQETDHPVAKLLKRPNRLQTWFEFCRDLIVARLLRGNAYAVVLRERGEPSELILINPDAVMVLEAQDGSIFYNVNRLGLFQIAVLQDFPVAIPAEDIFHLRGMAFNMLVGASTIGLAADAIGVSMGLAQQQSRWTANGARPSVVLESPKKLADPAFKRLKESWNNFNSGLENVGRTAVLEDGVQAKQLQLTSVDLQFIEQMNFSVEDIARFFGVPLTKLASGKTPSRGDAVLQEEQAYINGCIAPLLDELEQKFDYTFGLARDGVELDLNEDQLLRADPATRYNLGRVGALSGLISPNEWRRAERLPPVPGGDEVRAPVNMAALGSNMNGQAPDGAGRPPKGQLPDPGVPTDGGNDGPDPTATEG